MTFGLLYRAPFSPFGRMLSGCEETEQDHVRIDGGQEPRRHVEVAVVAALVEGGRIDELHLHLDADLAEVVDLELLELGDALRRRAQVLEREALRIAGLRQKLPGERGVVGIARNVGRIGVHPRHEHRMRGRLQRGRGRLDDGCRSRRRGRGRGARARRTTPCCSGCRPSGRRRSSSTLFITKPSLASVAMFSSRLERIMRSISPLAQRDGGRGLVLDDLEDDRFDRRGTAEIVLVPLEHDARIDVDRSPGSRGPCRQAASAPCRPAASIAFLLTIWPWW